MTQSRQWIKDVASKLNKENVRVTKTGTIYVNEIKLQPTKAAETILDVVGEDIDTESKLKLYECSNGKDSKSVSELLELIRRSQKKEAAKALDGSFEYPKSRIIVDIITDEEKVYDEERQEVTDLSVNVWLRATGKSDKEFQPCKIVYDPYTMKPVWDGEEQGRPCVIYNSHRFPAWRRSNTAAYLPDIYREFFEVFFTTDEAREYGLKWLAHGVVNRNPCVMVFLGAMGCGKGTFGEIFKSLVGEENFQSQTENSKRSRFNSEFKNKRGVFLDEYSADAIGKNILKYMANDVITYEQKNVAVGKQELNTASYIMANNNPAEQTFVQQDRRFSIPDICTKNLVSAWDVNKIEHLKQSVTDKDEEFEAFAKYLLENYTPDPIEMITPYKGEFYHKVCILNLRNWQRFIYGVIKDKDFNKEMLSISNLRDEFEDLSSAKTFPSDNRKISHFLENFLDSNGNGLGYIKSIKRKSFLVVDKSQIKLAPEFEEEEEDDFDI